MSVEVAGPANGCSTLIADTIASSLAALRAQPKKLRSERLASCCSVSLISFDETFATNEPNRSVSDLTEFSVLAATIGTRLRNHFESGFECDNTVLETRQKRAQRTKREIENERSTQGSGHGRCRRHGTRYLQGA